MTIINHTHRFVFVHIPKNAGTAVAMALAPLTTYRDLELGATDLGQAMAPQFRRRFGIGKHATLREILTLIGPAESPGYRTFCVTRDPFDRAVSMFAFLRRWTEWQELPAYVAHVPEFVACRSVDDFVRSDFFASAGPDRLFLPQMEWIRPPDGAGVGVQRLVPIADLQQGLRSFLVDIGVPDQDVQRVWVDVVNDSPRTGERGGLSDRAVEILQARYAEDLEWLGYPGSPR